MKPVWLLLHVFVSFFGPNCAQPCTTFNSIPIMNLILLANRNIALIYSVTICEKQQRIVHGQGKILKLNFPLRAVAFIREFSKKCAMTAKKCTRKRDTKAWGRSEIFQTWYLEKWISNHEDWTRLILISTPYEFLVLQQTLTPFRKLRLNFFCYVLTLTR